MRHCDCGCGVLVSWTGGPSQDKIAAIQARTHTDKEERRRYYRDRSGGWKRLRSAADFAELNLLIGEPCQR